MRPLRTFGFWIHLAAGVLAGLVIAMLSITGAALAFKPQITRWVDADVRQVTPSAAPLRASQLADAVRTAFPDLAVRTISVERDPAVAASVQAGTRTFYVDPYTGTITGEASSTSQQVFRSIENWHRWFALSGTSRESGRAITGAANAIFLLLSLTGLYLWWPRGWTRQYLRPILVFRAGARGKARDFNWHHVFGFWSLPAIVIMTASGVFMSYPSLNAWLPGARQGGGEPRAEGRPMGQPGGPAAAPAVDVDRAVIDAAVSAARAHQPDWQVLSLEMPRRADAPLTVALADRTAMPVNRSQLSVSASTGEVVKWQPAAAPEGAQRLRLWIRFGHTGELWGVIGQAIMTIGCLAGVMLVFTGWALAIRRLFASLRRSRPAAVAVAAH